MDLLVLLFYKHKQLGCLFLCTIYLFLQHLLVQYLFYDNTARDLRCARAAALGSGAGDAVREAALRVSELTTALSSSAPPGAEVGVMTHFWTTGHTDDSTFRYYIDGEATASVQFTAPEAAGALFGDTEGQGRVPGPVAHPCDGSCKGLPVAEAYRHTRAQKQRVSH